METLGIRLRQFALSLSASSTFFPPSLAWILDSEKNIDKTSITVRRRKPKNNQVTHDLSGVCFQPEKYKKYQREQKKQNNDGDDDFAGPLGV
jgi:hypothetical protein